MGTTNVALGATASSVSGLTIDGISPTTMGFLDATSSIQTQLNGKQPTLSSYSTIVNLFGSGSCTGYLYSDGTCSTPGGSGTVSDGSGTTTANELAVSTTTAHTIGYATTLPTAAEPAHTGDVTNTAGSLATTVVKVNGGSIPTSAGLVGTNSSGQFVTANAYVYKGTVTLSGTIASASSSTVSVAVTGATTSSVCLASFSAAFTGITGFVPSTSGMLAVGAYPTAGNCNFTIINNTSGSITMGSTVLNFVVF